MLLLCFVTYFAAIVLFLFLLNDVIAAHSYMFALYTDITLGHSRLIGYAFKVMNWTHSELINWHGNLRFRAFMIFNVLFSEDSPTEVTVF